ncbi:2-enoyl thioester reductase domain-containing protein [Rhodopseudomonas sp. B29]|uniref:MDR family NADPH-dependent oxidoreductase n=1 Tax=Rhodopseudomonas sp. B29 TaxID=95607 RepID=UPI0003B68F9B|nr:2-enoyl thioester reductase domain-containing protein [Rhodopseudomonas sp. B29]
MKKIAIKSYGEPDDVVACVEAPDVGEPGADEVVFRTVAFPINPADISFIRGKYRLKPPLPATPGAECVGRISAVGSAVGAVRRGDLVINLDRENWAQERRVKADRVIVLPPDSDPLQSAMLRINPPTARLLLDDFVPLKEGDWIIQNAANSSVGHLVIAFAKRRRLRTINVVRNEEAFPALKELGADACLVDGDGLHQRAEAITGGAEVRLGIDAVAGAATARIAACLAPGATLCAYGSMSGDPITVPSSEMIYRDIRLRGFLLGRHLDRRGTDEVQRFYHDIENDLREAKFRIGIERLYPIENIREALAHALRSRSSGKILVTPNGPVG